MFPPLFFHLLDFRLINMMNVGTDGEYQRKMFSPKPSPLVISPGFSPKSSPLPKSLGFSPKPSPMKKSQPVEKQEEPQSCCCLGKKSRPAENNRQTITPQQATTQRERRRVTFTQQLERVQEFISPRVSSAMLLRSPNLAAITSQAKIEGWCIEPHEIELHEQVGRGSTADIYRGSWKGLGVAVKCINPDFFHFNENGATFFAQEVETLSRQHHPFVLRLVGASLNPPQYGWVVTEFLSMTLKEWLHGNGNRRSGRTIPLPPLEDRIAKAFEIAQGMQYLHDQKPKLVHRDLKPSNVFMDEAMHVRVADFGHARFLSDGEKAHTGETGTYIYMAPEVIRCEPYTEKCDVFSYGVILNELMTGQHPYIETDYSPTEIALEVAEGNLRPALPEDNAQLGEIIELICHSWDGEMSRRPSFAIITSTLKSIQERFTTVPKSFSGIYCETWDI